MFRQGFKCLPKFNVINRFTLRQKSSDSSVFAVENPVVITDDGSTIVCWHPEKSFPYECTKPMPERLNKKSVLKTTREEAMTVMTRKPTDKEIVQEMAELTSTTFHRWYPRSRDKRAKKTPKDRTYL